MSEENYPVIRILPSALAETSGDEPFAVIVRSRDELCRWLRNPPSGLSWLQVEGILGDSDAWMEAAHSGSDVSLDLILADLSHAEVARIGMAEIPTTYGRRRPHGETLRQP